MTLSFTAHWHDELPGFYTALKPTPLQNARLIWHNDALADSLGIPSTLFQPEKGAGVWGGETLLPGMKPLAQVYSGHQFGVWADSSAMAAASCWVNSFCRMAKRSTGT